MDARNPINRTRSQLATYGLAAVLLAVSGFAIWSALSTSRLGEQAMSSSRLADHYSMAATAVAAQESLERKYRLEPGPQVRARHDAAAEKLVTALGKIARDGTQEDRLLSEDMRAAHAQYMESVHRLFEAADRGDVATVRRIDEQESDPRFEHMESMVDEASERHHQASLAALNQLHERERFNAHWMPVVFTLGLGLVALFSSVLRQTQSQLDTQRERAIHDSLHDALTGLPNRTLLADRFNQTLLRGRREHTATGLLMIDLDRFKEVNDTLGHHYGDRLLVAISRRLSAALRDADTMARLGGDEFAVLLPDVGGVDGAIDVARRLRHVLTQTVEIEGIDLEVEASIGVVVSGVHGDSATTLMQRADMAMYAAKSTGQGIGLYQPSADQHSPERLALLGQLRRAIERRELFLHYQPKVNLTTNQVAGVEALVRWQHPERGLVRPDEFIPYAEHTGLIGPLTRCVIDLALAQVKAWLSVGHRVPVSVNISARNLLDDNLVADVRELLTNHCLPAELLELELTETAIMMEPHRAKVVLEQLHALGVRIAIDDFGAGYTSLAQLKTLPIDELKIDKSFVLTMETDRSDALIVSSVVDLGHNLGMSVVAEGVETVDALGALSQVHCDMVQGYHLCRPQTAEGFMQWLNERAVAASATPATSIAA